MKDFSNIYFIGIGGIGMSALALYFLQEKKTIHGYDRTPSEITQNLENKGINIHFSDDISQIPESFKNPKNTLVIYTPAVKNHSELTYFQNNGFQVVKRSQVLGLITQNSFCLAVAGTHGKTTTSSILSHILAENNASFSAFLGGIAENFNSNFILKGNDLTVVEADEFDRSFLQLSPNIACITATDADHLDIYHSEENFLEGFSDFTKKIKFGGTLLVREGLPFEGITFGFEKGNYAITNHSVNNGKHYFSISYPNGNEQLLVENCVLPYPGKHNLLNALAAVAMAHQAGFPIENLVKSLTTFKGVKRRFSYQIHTETFSFIDDYAHHPSELEALHQGIREMHPNKKITIIFQPHLFTRTRDFAQGFADSLSKFDRVVLLDIYPARELPIEGITSKWLFEKIKNKNKTLLSKEKLSEWLSENSSEILVTAGAGDIGAEVEKIKRLLQ